MSDCVQFISSSNLKLILLACNDGNLEDLKKLLNIIYSDKSVVYDNDYKEYVALLPFIIVNMNHTISEQILNLFLNKIDINFAPIHNLGYFTPLHALAFSMRSINANTEIIYLLICKLIANGADETIQWNGKTYEQIIKN